MKYKRQIKLILSALGVVLLIYLTIALTPWIASLGEEQNRAAFKEMITSQGFLGWLIILGIQILQIIVALIPGEPVEILAGFVYGTWGGLLTCLLGIGIGSAIIFIAVHYMGEGLVNKMASSDKISKFKFLKDTKNIELIVFILFFIPGTPKDVLTYFSGLTPIKPLRVIFIATVARIPSVVSSTLAGAQIESGNWVSTIIIFAITGLLGIAGILYNRKLLNKLNKKNGELNA